MKDSGTRTIILNVSDEIATMFERLTEQEKQAAIETLVRLLNDKRSLFEVMEDISEYAKKQGMTEEILKDQLVKTVSLSLDERLANRLLKMSKQEINDLMYMLQRVLDDKRPLEQIILDAQNQTKNKGLTQEKMDDILRDLE